MVQMLFALAMIGVAVAFGIESAAYSPTAARMPGLLSWAVGLLAVGMLIEAALTHRKAREAAAEPLAEAPDLPVHASEAHAGGSLPRALGFLLFAAVYAISFRWVGFALGSILFLGGTMLLFRATRPIMVLVTVLAAIVVIYAVFIAFLRLPIPIWPAL